MYYHNGLLWPGRFSEKVIQDFQSTLGSRAFAGQLMQSPVSESGNIIKRAWVKIISRHEFQALFDKEKPDVKLFVDTAYTAKQENDASAISVVTKINNNVYIIKSLKVWEEFPDMIKTLKSVSKEYKATIIYIESKASGLSIKQQLQRDGFNVGDLSPKDKDKVTRVNAVAPSIEGGHLWLVEDNSNEMVLSELASFPYGHDDLTDTIVYSIENLINTSGFNYSFL
jgi:predicted phage terminase large subunit-like protein